jgi:RNA-splicing ligase RtcB
MSKEEADVFGEAVAVRSSQGRNARVRPGLEIPNRGLAEEAPFAYKDLERVVRVVERAGLATSVAQLRPIGFIKG